MRKNQDCKFILFFCFIMFFGGGCSTVAERAINRATDGALDRTIDRSIDAVVGPGEQLADSDTVLDNAIDRKLSSVGVSQISNANRGTIGNDEISQKSNSVNKIRTAQAALIVNGYDPGVVDGVNGPKTKEALKCFQRDNNLSPTGVLDEITCQKLGIS